MNNKTFRKLNASEIECRIAQVNKGGAMLLLYKDARVDQNILDETFGIFGWKRTHQMIGDRLYCTVEVKDPESGEWVSKQDVGTESYTEKEKGQASDSFKRACFNLGIGRELYTAPNIFFPKDKLKSFKDEGAKPSCYDTFRVKDITYTADGNSIATVTVECLSYGKVHSSLVFSNDEKVVNIQSKTATKTETASSKKETPVQKTQQPSAKAADNDSIGEDEIIKIGNCRGKKYSEVKDTEAFASFMSWIKTANGSYDDEVRQRQFVIFKKMAQKGA